MSKVMEEVHLTTIKPRNNVLLLAQEISFAKVLACNDKRLRDRGIKRLKKWFMTRSQASIDFGKEDLMRIWKGLFYCMWMADKPLTQEDLAEEISHLLHSFSYFKASLLFVETFFASLSVEWFGIDQLRLDKFMMLVRRFLRQSLELVARIGWSTEETQQLADVYYQTLTTAPMGLSMHIIEIFCEELAKVGKGQLSSGTILQFVTVFANVMATLKDGRLISQITRCIFLHLIRQTEIGTEHQMKFSAWKEFGFPGGDVDAAEKIDTESNSDEEDLMEGSDQDEEEEREEGIDARAGKVDVVLPPLDFDPRDLLEVLRPLRNKKETTTKARKTLIQLISKFETLASGKYPLGIHKVEIPVKNDKRKEISKLAKKLCLDEWKSIHSESKTDEDEDVPAVSKEKTGKKKKALKKNKSSWEVSDLVGNEENNDNRLGTSWEVSESPTKNISINSKKRKLDSEENSAIAISNGKKKKAKVSSFSACDSKENSMSSPVGSKPQKANAKNVLKKRISNEQNTPVKQNKLTPKSSVSKKRRKKCNSENKKGISNKSTTSVASDIEELPASGAESVENVLPAISDGTKNSTENCEKNENTSGLLLNTSTTDKNNGWGGEWEEEPLQSGEYEIFIPNKKYVEKRKSLGLPYPVSSFVQKSAEKLTPVNRFKNSHNAKSSTPNSQKRVEFNLGANCAQDYKEYTRSVKKNKSNVPFDAAKKPVQGLLKNSTPSPINPFYKKKLKFLASPNVVSSGT